MAEEKNSLVEWDPSKTDVLAPTQDALDAVLAERDAALATHDRSAAALDEQPFGLRPAALAALREHMESCRLYLSGFAAVTRALMLARFLSVPQPPAARLAADARLDQALEALLDLAATFARVEALDLRPAVVTVLSAERLRTLHADLAARRKVSPLR